jgi:hypothetical protein
MHLVERLDYIQMETITTAVPRKAFRLTSQEAIGRKYEAQM